MPLLTGSILTDMNPTEHPILMTPRLILRDYEPSDWQAVHAYASDAETTQFMVWGPNTEPQQTQDFLMRMIATSEMRPRYEYELAVIRKEDGMLIGGCGLYLTNQDQREGSIGYCFGRDYWGQGYATEAARQIVAFGFAELGLHRIFTRCQAENLASARVMEKIGMRREGLFLEERWAKGRWWDVPLYAILDKEWQNQRSSA